MEKGFASAFVIRWPVWPSGPRRELDRARADIHDGQELKGSLNRPDTEAQDQLLQIITFGLQRAAGPYRWAMKSLTRCTNFEKKNSKRGGPALLDRWRFG
jgi:hypothetical protein